MKKKRNIWFMIISVVAGLTAACIYDNVQGSTKTYEIRPEIMTPEYKTDTTRVMDAYERMMDRYVDSTEKQNCELNAGIKSLSEDIDKIQSQMDLLFTKLEGIEKALGIEPAPRPSKEPAKPEIIEEKTQP